MPYTLPRLSRFLPPRALEPNRTHAEGLAADPIVAAPWTVRLSSLLHELGTGLDGLRSADAADRLSRYGANEIAPASSDTLVRQILERFSNPLILILLFAASISAWTGDTVSFVIIVLIISLSVALDLSQQRRADAAVRNLQRSVALHADVVRNGMTTSLPVSELVPGDIIHLAAGDIVPADARVLSARDLFVNQALMTGESAPLEKRPADTVEPDIEEQASENWLFMGTSVTSGAATALVCRTGKRAAISQVAVTLSSARPRDAFDQGIRRFGFLMVRFTTLLVVFVISINAVFGRPWLDSLLFALALAVGLTPELLPMVVTVTLSKGAQRMAAQRVIVKRLAAIHDLGAVDVLCTDKTGTLTEANIELVRWIGAGGAPDDSVLELAAVNSMFETGVKSPIDGAIMACKPSDLSAWQKIDEVPFDFERRRASILAHEGERRLLIAKGAPEDVMRVCTEVASAGGPMPIDPRLASRQLEALGQEGFRVLAVAFRPMPADATSARVGDEAGMTLAGFLAFADPPKKSAAAAIADLLTSGVEVKILTGDHEQVTRHVCSSIGVAIKGLITGPELTALPEDALKARLASTNVFCRVNPQQKHRILLALKDTGKVAGFMGDGINDAPALRAADVGISVDTAADVAKDAADIVLLEHDLGAVHAGVLEGRRTVENVSKYVLMGASSNFGNMFSMAGAALLLPFLPMLPTQVLLNNLLYDLSEVGVPFDNVDDDAVRRPVHWEVDLVERFMLVIGPVSSLFDFLTFYILLHVFGANEAQFQTGWFLESIVTQVCVILIIRTRKAPWLSTPHPVLVGLGACAIGSAFLVALTPLGSVFKFAMPPAGFFAFMVIAVVGYLAAVEGVKRLFFARWRIERAHPART